VQAQQTLKQALRKEEPPKADSQKKWEWPDSLDALIAAPQHHKILLENDRARVLEVTIQPGVKEPVHHHRWPSILHVLKAGAFRDYDSTGNVLFDSRTASPPPTYPLTMWLEPQPPHTVENLGAEVIHLIRVELKQ
jgi:hypothetical protein